MRKLVWYLLFAFFALHCGSEKDPVALGKKLIDAAEEGDVKEVIRLIDKKADVKAVDRIGKSALSYAALNGEDEVVEVLLKAGAGENLDDSVSNVLVVAIKMNQQESRDPKKYSRYERILKMLAAQGIK